MVRDKDFDSTVPLPPGLTIAAIKRSVDYIERDAKEFVDP